MIIKKSDDFEIDLDNDDDEIIYIRQFDSPRSALVRDLL